MPEDKSPERPTINDLMIQFKLMAARAGFSGGAQTYVPTSADALNDLLFSMSSIHAVLDGAAQPAIRAGSRVVVKGTCSFGNYPTNRTQTLTSGVDLTVLRVWYCQDKNWRLEFNNIKSRDGMVALYLISDFVEKK